jgi:hypothetical protein
MRMDTLLQACGRFIAKHPGLNNTDLHRAMQLDRYSKRAFVSHFLANTCLVEKKRSKRIVAQYYPTQKVKNDTDHEDDALIATIHAEFDALLEEIRDFVVEHIAAHKAVCVSEIAKHLNLYDTINRNHRAWVVWEPLRANATSWGFVGKKYADMSADEKEYVSEPIDGRKVYYVPVL